MRPLPPILCLILCTHCHDRSFATPIRLLTPYPHYSHALTVITRLKSSKAIKTTERVLVGGDAPSYQSYAGYKHPDSLLTSSRRTRLQFRISNMHSYNLHSVAVQILARWQRNVGSRCSRTTQTLHQRRLTGKRPSRKPQSRKMLLLRKHECG
jgi:hypothetical protein